MKASVHSAKTATTGRASATTQLVGKPTRTLEDNRPAMVAQRKLQGVVSSGLASTTPQCGALSAIQLQRDIKNGTIQRVLYKGIRTDKIFSNASPKAGYTKEQVREFIDSKKEYVYDKTADKIYLKEERAAKKAKKESTGKPREISGWMKTVDQGVGEYNEQDDREEIKFVAREKQDANVRGAAVGINNIAYFSGMTETHEIKMTNNQSAINYYTAFVKNEMEDEYERSSDEKKEKENKDKRKEEVGPEIQQLIGWEGDEFFSNIGGNTSRSQEAIREEFLNSDSDTNTLGTHHRRKYRKRTVSEAIRKMRQRIANSAEIEKELLKMIDKGKSEEKIAEQMKKLIGNGYKDDDLRKLYKLRNALKVKYGDYVLEDAEILVPDNPKGIHSESNLLDNVSSDFKIADVVGTKVPCVACFTKFCKNGKHSHLLQYTSFIWFSEPCMTQLECDYSAKSTEEVVSYLEEIHAQMGPLVDKVKKYAGKMGDIKPAFTNDDSDSMGEESRIEVVRKMKRKRESVK